MKHIRWIWLLLATLALLTSCLPTGDSRDSLNTTQASLTIGVNVNDPRIAGPDRALNTAPPANITRIVIRIFSQDQEIAVGDILASGGVLTLTVPPGVALGVSGAAYADTELRYKGEATVPPLLPGLGASVKLNLESSDGPDFSLPIQIDITAGGVRANAASSSPVFSENNRKVLFRSLADNLGENDTNNKADLFVKDLRNGTLTPIHTNNNGVLANDTAGAADMTADGQRIVFDSVATNLDITQPDTNNSRDIFLKDLTGQRITRLSRPVRGARGDSQAPSISQDGRLVVFESAADLLGTGQTGVFLVDTATDGTLQYIAPGRLPQMSGDGSAVLWYDSAAQALRIRILDTGSTATVYTPFTVDENAATRPYDLSADGRFVVFAVTGPALSRTLSFSSGVYLFDRSSPTGSPRLVSSRSDAQSLPHEDGVPSQPTLSDDGRFVAFVLGTTIYIKDTGNEILAALSASGAAPTLSADGSLIAFAADANQNLYVLRNPLYTAAPAGPVAVTFTLSVASEGSGHGQITSDTGLDCGTVLCSQPLSAGTLVHLRAVPDELSDFAGWAGDCTDVLPEPALTLTANSNCIAKFEPKELSVQVTIRGGPNAGSITSTAGADTTAPTLACSNRAEQETVCSQTFRAGTALKLLPTPLGNNTTVAWLGCDSEAGLEGCQIVVNAERRVTVNFGTSSFPLTVRREGAGTGTITSADEEINCGTSCENTYINNTRVSLTATASGDSRFTGWSGDCSGTRPAFSIDIRGAASCTATFVLDDYALNIQRAGNGTGVVTSADGGIDCGTRCSREYVAHTEVELRAAPANENMLFTGWSGGCSGSTPSVRVLLDADRACTATFTRRTVALSVAISGSGRGVVTSTPTGINCGAVCEQPFEVGTSVRLRAAAGPGAVFSGWGGACTGVNVNTTVAITAAASCTATFTLRATLTVSVNGSGTVTSDAAGINCGNDCDQTYNDAPTITLRANPASGFLFGGWSGDCSGVANPTPVVVDTAKTCVATFLLPATLQITRTGSGTVTSDPAGINCGTDCEQRYDNAPTVTLRAVPAAGFVFAGWGGACGGTDLSTEVLVDTAKTCSARFTQRATLTVSRNGSGTITSDPAGINCGADCTEAYDNAPTVTLRANPADGFVFTSWSGACTGNTVSANVVVDSDKSCAATFVQRATLRVTRSGNGTVTSDPAGINCGTDCEQSYDNAPSVTLRAAPAAGFVFTGWGGACSGTDTSTSVPVDGAKTCSANFTQRATLNVTLNGVGTVTSNPAGIDCSSATEAGDDCSETYDGAPTVTLRATPDFGWVFTRWGGQCEGTTLTTSVTITAARQCSATFVQRVTLTVSRDGNGDGVITGDGINCGTDCNQAYDFGAVVALQARAAAGSVFSGWSGDCRVSNRGGGADVTMNEDATCTATFQRRVDLRVNFDGAGAGRVTLDPGNRQCSSDCTNTFDLNDQVQLVAVPDRSTVFRGWSGDCAAVSGNAEAASVRMDSDKSCTARFAARFTLTIQKTGTGDGVVVTRDSDDIFCGELCSAVYEEGTQVDLGVDATNGRFTSWGGDCSGTGVTASVTMNGDRTCIAEFQADVTLSVDPSGSGSISSEDGLINCGRSCNAEYAPGTRVTLTAQPTPGSGSVFSRWSGDCGRDTTPTITFVVDQRMACSASFVPGNFINDITLTPPTPAELGTNRNVEVSFTYNTLEAGGVRIFARPMTNGELTPRYAASGSPLLPTGSGKGSQSFTITGTELLCGSQHVDQVRLQMWDAEQTTQLLEQVITVDYTFFDPCIG